MDNAFHYLAGTLVHVDDGKRDLSVASAELLDDGGRLTCSASHDVIRFLHGGGLLSVSAFGNRTLSNRCQPPPSYVQLNSGRPEKMCGPLIQTFGDDSARGVADRAELLRSTPMATRETIAKELHTEMAGAPASQTAPPATERLGSLDTFRGFIIFWIIGGDALLLALHTL